MKGGGGGKTREVKESMDTDMILGAKVVEIVDMIESREGGGKKLCQSLLPLWRSPSPQKDGPLRRRVGGAWESVGKRHCQSIPLSNGFLEDG